MCERPETMQVDFDGCLFQVGWDEEISDFGEDADETLQRAWRTEPLRKRERMMQGFRSPGGLQCFISAFSAVRNLFVPPRSQRSAFQNRVHRIHAITEWNTAAGAMI
jgi:hypothetical protein